MRVRELLNIILLSVSLSTVLISIVSYILFKVKQKNNAGNEENPLEGVFFRKYAPHILKKIEEERRRLEEEGKKPRSFKIKFTVAFGVLFLIVISGMFLENYFNFRESLNNRITTANRIRTLIDEGLLQVYKYNPTENVKEMDEEVPNSLKNYEASLFERMRPLNFCFYSNTQSQKYSKYHTQRLENWIKYFTENSLKATKTDQLNLEGCRYIFVHVNALNTSQRQNVNKMLQEDSGRKTIVIGELGTLNGIGGVSNEPIPLPFVADKSKSKSIRSYKSYRAKNEINIIPPGKVLTISPVDIFVEFYADKSSLLYDKELKTTFYNQHKNTLYLGLGFTISDGHHMHYANAFILDRIANFLDIERAYISYWPAKSLGALTVNLELTGEIEINNRFEERLKDYEIPFSVILPTSLVGRYGDVMSKKFSEVIPTLVNSQGYFDMTTFELFNTISKLRLDIEEKTALKVSGYTVQNRIQNNYLMNASRQNHLNYFLGIENFNSTYPVNLGNEFYYLTSTTFSDVQTDKKLLLESKPLAALFKRKVIEEGAMFNYIINPSTENYIDQDLFLSDLLEDLKDDEVWVTTPGELIKWVNVRDQLSLAWANTADSKRLILKNLNNEDVVNLELKVVSDKTPDLATDSFTKINDSIYILLIDELQANEEKIITFK